MLQKLKQRTETEYRESHDHFGSLANTAPFYAFQTIPPKLPLFLQLLKSLKTPMEKSVADSLNDILKKLVRCFLKRILLIHSYLSYLQVLR